MKNIIYIVLFFLLTSCGNKVGNRVITENSGELKDTISGIYTLIPYQDENIPSCNLRIEIAKTGNIYNYHLSSNERDVSSKLDIMRNSEISDKIYLVFNDILYDSDEHKDEGILTVSGTLANDTLIFQTYGNSMNEYIQLGECGDKYIALVRKPQ